MKLNLGCGRKLLDGWVNVDHHPPCDVLLNLETPWPWANSSVDEVQLIHVLEHLGEQTGNYLGIIKELYRVCRDGAEIRIVVPHPRHDDFLNDPTHVRPITVEQFLLFSKKKCREWIEMGAANTPLAMQIDVDFEIVRAKVYLDEMKAMKQLEFVLRVIKPNEHIGRMVAEAQELKLP